MPHMNNTYRGGVIWPVVLVAGVMAGLSVRTALAASDAERIAELERKVDILTEQSEKAQFRDVFVKPGESAHGMGPAASKVYHKEEGLSVGGYGEALYQNREDKSDEFDFLRAVLYFGYKYNEQWVFNSEIEVEHAHTGKEGEVEVEFAYVDYLYRPELNLRAGMMLVPMGLINELHEPTVFLSARRPAVEQVIIPTTWRENGVGLFGDVGPVAYKTYVLTGFRGEDFTPGGLRDGRQSGSKSVADDFAWIGRLDWTVAPGLLVGGSAYLGDSGQDLPVDVGTEIYEAHLDLKRGGLEFRALGVIAQLDDVAELNRIIAAGKAEDGIAPPDSEIDSIGEELQGWYVQLGYDVFSLRSAGSESSLTPYVRYETYDTQDKIPSGFKKNAANEVEIVTVGLNFKPIDELVFKVEHQFVDNEANTGSDQTNVAMGYVF